MRYAVCGMRYDVSIQSAASVSATAHFRASAVDWMGVGMPKGQICGRPDSVETVTRRWGFIVDVERSASSMSTGIGVSPVDETALF